LVLYGIVLAVSPALHHDFACHLTDPGHCNACHATPAAPQAERAFDFAPPRLAAVPSVETREDGAVLTLFPLRSSGRAPPA
jgi:hypothetical protein